MNPCQSENEWGHSAEHAVTAVRELADRYGFPPNFNMLAGATTLTNGVLCMCAIDKARRAGLIAPNGRGFGGCAEGGYEIPADRAGAA